MRPRSATRGRDPAGSGRGSPIDDGCAGSGRHRGGGIVPGRTVTRIGLGQRGSSARARAAPPMRRGQPGGAAGLARGRRGRACPAVGVTGLSAAGHSAAARSSGPPPRPAPRRPPAARPAPRAPVRHREHDRQLGGHVLLVRRTPAGPAASATSGHVRRRPAPQASPARASTPVMRRAAREPP